MDDSVFVRPPMRSGPTGFWPLQIGGWTAFAAAMLLGRVGEFPGPVILLVEWPFALLGFLTTLLLHRFYLRSRLGAESSIRTLVLVVVASYLGGMLWTAGFHTYLHYVAVPLIPVVSPGSVNPFRRGPLLDNTVYNTLTLLAWSTVHVVLTYRDALFEQRSRVLRARAEARDAQLQVLAYQLNPHFLFNTLNSLRALIDEDRERARRMVTELSSFLRYALTERPLHMAPLAEEVSALQGYLAIESIRFEDRLDVQMEIAPDAAGCLVPAFLLIPLMENALKHGIPAAGGGPLRVRVSARLGSPETLVVVVENDGVWRDEAEPEIPVVDSAHVPLAGDGGVGLRNVRARLEHLFADRHRFAITQQGDQVRVMLELPAVRPDRHEYGTEAAVPPPHADRGE